MLARCLRPGGVGGGGWLRFGIPYGFARQMSEVPEVGGVVVVQIWNSLWIWDLWCPHSFPSTPGTETSLCTGRFPILHDILQCYLMHSHQGAFCLQPVVTTATNPLVMEHGK